MRNRLYFDHSTEEISWTFNDFILGFLMIVLMMASMFAFLSNSVVVDSFINQCEDPSDPDCGTGNSLFGGKQRGARSDKVVLSPNADDPNVEKASAAEVSIRKWAGIGDKGGNSELAYGTPKLNPQKENIVFEILPTGNLIYRGEDISVEDMRKLINAIAIEKGVFLEAIVHEGTPFEVYKVVRNELWDLGEAEHWRDVVQSSENSEGLTESLSKYGTTFLEKAETKTLQEAPRKESDFFGEGFGEPMTDFGSGFEEDSFDSSFQE
ncbi:MAG TPA: hypothetical protein VIT68_01750 [Candidatus Gracilibacteria bacterium]